MGCKLSKSCIDVSLSIDIRSGITAQDRVIINGGSRVQQPGQKVKANPGRITRTPTTYAAPVTTAPPAATATSASALSGSVAIGD